MLCFLVMNGFPADYVYWEIGIFEFQYIFLNTLKIRAREMQQSALPLIGAIGTFFMKEQDKDKSFHSIMDKVVVEIDKITASAITPLSLILSDFGVSSMQSTLGDFTKFMKPMRGLPPGGIPKESK